MGFNNMRTTNPNVSRPRLAAAWRAAPWKQTR